MNYKEAYSNMKNGPWSEFFNAQDLDYLMDMLDKSKKTFIHLLKTFSKNLKMI